LFNKKKAGERIKLRRAELHITKAQLAKRLDLSSGFIRMVESGQRFFKPENLLTLSEILDVSIDYIIKGDEESFVENEEMFKKSEKENLIGLVKMDFTKEECLFFMDLFKILEQNTCTKSDYKSLKALTHTYFEFMNDEKTRRE